MFNWLFKMFKKQEESNPVSAAPKHFAKKKTVKPKTLSAMHFGTFSPVKKLRA